jgi:hypothetical protein
MTLLGLLGRALAVALLFGVILLPAADHHLAGRLPGAHGSTVHRYVTHHHSAADHPTDAAPLLLPLGAASLGVSLPSPFADQAQLLPPPFLLGQPLATVGTPPTAPLAQPPPLPPPILPA